MRLDHRAVGTLLATELRLLLRDRRTVVVSIVLPLLVMPLLLFAGRTMEEHRARRLEATAFTFTITGSQRELAHRLLREAGSPHQGFPLLKLEEKSVEDAAAALAEGSLDLWVEALAPEEVPPRPVLPPKPRPPSEEEEWVPGVPLLRLVFRGDKDRSAEAAQRLQEALRRVRQQERIRLLAQVGFALSPEDIARVQEQDVASAQQVTGLRVGRLLTVFFLLFVLSGGAVVATDTLAGEKERGTLETLLTTAAGRREIVLAKLLAILAVAGAITLIQAANFLAYVVFRLVPLPQGFALDLSPATALAVVAMLVPVAALVSSLLLLTSGLATSYKEAQLYFFPTFLLTLAPALASFLPGLELRSPIALVPIAGVAVGIKDILIGAADVPLLVATWLVNAVAAFAAALAVERTLTSERLILSAAEPAAEPPSPRTFQRQVVRIFAVLWAILLVVSLQLESRLDVRAQVVIHVVLLFGGGTLVLLRRYRLDPRQALALRPVRWPVWLAVAIGAPAGLLTGIGVFLLANLVVPVPPQVLEGFSQALFPPDVPFWHALLFLALLPGIFEEATFRGLLLYGLHRRLRPLALALAVGAVFGAFHLALFRLAPSAYLGVLLTAVTLLSGSLFPAMVWHTAHNALALTAARLGAPLEEATPLLYLLAAAALGVSAFILWRARTPYPGLRHCGGEAEGGRISGRRQSSG